MFVIYAVYLLGAVLALELSKSRLKDNIQGMLLSILFSWISVVILVLLDYKRIRR